MVKVARVLPGAMKDPSEVSRTDPFPNTPREQEADVSGDVHLFGGEETTGMHGDQSLSMDIPENTLNVQFSSDNDYPNDVTVPSLGDLLLTFQGS